MSKLNAILDAITAKETAAAPKIGPNTLKAVKRKLPKKQDPDDAAYQVTVSAAETPERLERLAMGGLYTVWYRVEVTLITPEDGDAAKYLEAHTDWREAVRARYMAPDPLPGLEVVNAEVTTGAMLDRARLADQYGYDQLTIELRTHEVRT